GGLGGVIKWPNDVLIQGRKVAGVLIEMVPVDGAIGGWDRVALIGVGINANNASPVLTGGERPAISVVEAGGSVVDLDAGARALAAGLGRCADRGLGALERAEIERIDSALHAPAGGAFIGDERVGVDGIEPDGSLRVRMPDGRMRCVARSGEIRWS
ncbi:MAG: hypothetical protein ACTS3F_05190, partial [Phycisphaerales bacterium]